MLIIITWKKFHLACIWSLVPDWDPGPICVLKNSDSLAISESWFSSLLSFQFPPGAGHDGLFVFCAYPGECRPTMIALWLLLLRASKALNTFVFLCYSAAVWPCGVPTSGPFIMFSLSRRCFRWQCSRKVYQKLCTRRSLLFWRLALVLHIFDSWM